VVREHLRARALYDRAGFHFRINRLRSLPHGLDVTIDVLERSL
jgi:hypothetical protein